jgi:hypothetical protein
MKRLRPLWIVALAALVGGMLALDERGPRTPISDEARDGADMVATPVLDAPRDGSRRPHDAARPAVDDRALREAIARRASDRWVDGAGIVADVLPDDRRGSRHQRFILRLPDGATVLVAHNIDVAPRIDGLREGDRVEFHGEFEWNDRGGVVHWTHHDPQGRRDGGWLRHGGRTYR